MPYPPTIREEELKNRVATDLFPSLIADLRAAMKALAAQIAPKVYEHGFLK